jgi:hypothetical protein
MDLDPVIMGTDEDGNYNFSSSFSKKVPLKGEYSPRNMGGGNLAFKHRNSISSNK